MLNTLAVVALFAFQPVGTPQMDIVMDWNLAKAWAEEHPLSYLRVEFSTPGGPLPFVLESDSVLNSDDEVLNWEDQHGYSSHILNGNERIGARIKVQSGGYAGSAKAEINFQQYDSKIEAVGTGSCTTPSILPIGTICVGAPG